MAKNEKNKLITNLYWAVEELKAYTDLSGNRFDIDSALRRMQPIDQLVKVLNQQDINDLYDELMEQLSIPSFFDKMAFSEKVDLLFGILVSD